MLQLWRMKHRSTTPGHPLSEAADETVHGTWSQGVNGMSFTRAWVTDGDGFAEFSTEVFGVTAGDEPAAVRIGIVGHLHPYGLRRSPRWQSRECGVGHLWVKAAAGSRHVITGENSDRTERSEGHARRADTQCMIVDDDRVGRGSRPYEDESRTDGENDQADKRPECRPVRNGHHSHDEDSDDDPP